MLAVMGAAVGGAIGYATKARAGDAQMIDLPAEFEEIWSFDAKKWVYDQWDPEKPRTYENFNPFERNDESAMCDTNGCFPGQSRGYKSPVRPDQYPRLPAACDSLPAKMLRGIFPFVKVCDSFLFFIAQQVRRRE